MEAMREKTKSGGTQLIQILWTCMALAAMSSIFSAVALAQTNSSTSGNAAISNLIKTTHKGSIVLDSTVTILETANAPVPIQKAAQDLASDFQKVMGKKPCIITSQAEAGPITILIGEQANIPEAMRNADLKAPESFSISVTSASFGDKPSKVVLLTGPDMRGTMYAIYEFSQEYLGVDPMYYWTDHEPAHRASVEVPASLNKQFPAPLFKYRGFFINDEDLL